MFKFLKRDKKNYVMGREDNTSDLTITAIAKCGEEPLYTQTQGNKTYGLYLIGNDELWLDVNKVNSMRAVLESGKRLEANKDEDSYEKDLEAVAFLSVDAEVNDDNGDPLFLYTLPSGEIKGFKPEEVVRKRKEIRNRPVEKSPKELRFEGVCRRNECLVVNGPTNCDESYAIFVDEEGKFVRTTIGAVKRKRIEMGLEKAPDEIE